MAPLNPKAPEFISVTSFLPYYNQHLPILSYSSPTPTYFYPPFSGFHVIENPASFSVYYCNANFICVSPLQWQFNPPTPSLSMVPALPCDTMAEEQMEEEKKVVIEVRPRVAAKGQERSFFLRRGNSTEGIQGYNSHEKMIRKPRLKLVNGERSPGRKIEPKIVEIEPIEREGTKTTLMIRNLPNKYTGMLLNLLDEHCIKENQKLQLEKSTEVAESFSSAFDFVYLPMDFGSKCNKGYAFVNFTEPGAAWRLHLSLHNQKWDMFGSKKICEITYARIQGKDALIKHFQNTTFACETDEFLPVYFDPGRDGLGKSVVQFTVGRRLATSRRT